MKFIKYWLFTLNIILFSCIDEPNKIVVHTGLVTEISEQGALFTGSAQGATSSAITEHGFVWSLTDDLTTVESSRYRITESIQGEFQQLVQSELSPNVEYFVRAYAIEGNVTFYGQPVKFTSKGSLGPVITAFDPISGSSSAIITIDGANFSSKPNSNKVSIGPFICTVQSSTASQIKAQLPSNITISGLFKVKVEVGKITVQSTDNFTLTGPVITNITPISAIQGTVITITGSGFSPTPANNLIKFGQTVSSVVTASPTQLIVPVPSTNFAGSVSLTVTVSGITGLYEQLFTIEGPEIFSISPAAEYPGKELTINGKNFSAIPSENLVLFGNYHQAEVISASTTEVKVKIPGGVTNGVVNGFATPIDVSIKVTEKTATKVSSFTPLSPWSSLNTFPGVARTNATGFAIGQTGYVGLGRFSPNCSCYLNDFWGYNSQNDSWTQIASLPGQKRDYAISFTLHNKGYVGGGYALDNNMIEKYDLWEYDPTLNQWTQKNDFPGNAISEYAKAININDEIYVVSGGSLLHYDPNLDTWNARTGYPGPSGQYPGRIIAFGINGKIYESLDDIEFHEYDPMTDSWTRKADIPSVYGSWKYDSFSVQGKGYVGGGLNYVDYGKRLEFHYYDPVLDSWKKSPGAATTVYHSAYFEINGNVYFVTGGDQQVTQSGIKYNPNY